MSNANVKVVERLLETVSWLFLHPLTDELVATPSDASTEEIEAVLAQVQQRRAEELSLTNARPPGVHTGRLLLLLVDMNLMDGAASTASGGFFDELNLPPVVTWVDLTAVGTDKDKALICWVPEDCVSRAQAGIDVNPEECIGWASELAPRLHQDLADAVEGYIQLMGVE